MTPMKDWPQGLKSWANPAAAASATAQLVTASMDSGYQRK
jgi:hypothetical protein